MAGGLNTFGYAYQNPVVNFDPDGQFVWFGVPAYVWVTGGGAAAAAAWWAANSNTQIGPWPGSTTRDDPGKAGEDAADEIEDEQGGGCDLDDPEACKEAARKCKDKWALPLIEWVAFNDITLQGKD